MSSISNSVSRHASPSNKRKSPHLSIHPSLHPTNHPSPHDPIPSTPPTSPRHARPTRTPPLPTQHEQTSRPALERAPDRKRQRDRELQPQPGAMLSEPHELALLAPNLDATAAAAVPALRALLARPGHTGPRQRALRCASLGAAGVEGAVGEVVG